MDINNNNPLLQPFVGRYNQVPFASIKTGHFAPAIEQGIEEALAEIDGICKNEAEPDFRNTIVALERAGRSLEQALNVFYPLLSALSTQELMDISLEMAPKLSEYSTSITLNRQLWQRIKNVYDNRDKWSLDGEDAMLLKETYDSFRRSGALLQDEDRNRLRQLNAELTELTTRFGQNVLQELNRCEVQLGADELDGLPQRIVEEAAAEAAAKGHDGKYLFTLAQPVYMSFMKYSSRRDLREKMYRLYTGRNISGEFSNTDIVRRITALRLEKARLLGYDTYADYSLAHTMSGSKKRVFELLESLADAYRPAQHSEFERLNAFAKENSLIDSDMQPWDYSYVANKLKETQYECDEEQYRQYFPLDAVEKGVFSLATRLYGITFTELDDVEVYHPDVKVYEVNDADGSYLGLLYTDFFPRESKRPGAWMTDFGGEWQEDDGTSHRPLVSIVMNFTKPSGERPALLSTSEVGTFLHEFGHALHGLLAKTKYSSLSGTNVYRDFVELPSQFNENFLTCPEFLKTFARHWRTSEPIPQDMIDRLVKARQFGAAYACMRQLNFGILDMKWHTITEPVDDVESFENKASECVKMFEPLENSLVSPQFSHIFSGGYAAGYYSYKWAELLDADAFSAFEEKGVFDRDTAMSFRRNILEKGGTEAPDELYRRFRGHDASIEALLRRDGIKP